MIYILDDEEYIVKAVKKLFPDKKLRHFRESKKLIENAKKEKVEFAVFDLHVERGNYPSENFFGEPHIEGLSALKEFRKIFPDIPAILVTRYANHEIFERVYALNAIPIEAMNLENLPEQLKDAFNVFFRDKNIEYLKKEYAEEGYIVESPQMVQIIKKAEEWKDIQEPILITGETGVGKDALAYIIHKRSKRKKERFERFNIAAYPPDNLYQMLFGNEARAFTGVTQNVGLFELIEEGTLLLEEIGDLTPEAQKMLLHVIDVGEFRRMQGKEDIKFTGRLMLTTNKNLNQLVKDELFREDLLGRIEGFHLHIPPLRERREDIKAILERELKDIEISKNAYDYLVYEYHYPRNVRQLLNIVKRLKMRCSVIGFVTLDNVLEVIGKSFDVVDNYENNFENEELNGSIIFDYLRKHGITVDELEELILKEGIKKIGRTWNEEWKKLGFSKATFYRRLKEMD